MGNYPKQTGFDKRKTQAIEAAAKPKPKAKPAAKPKADPKPAPAEKPKAKPKAKKQKPHAPKSGRPDTIERLILGTADAETRKLYRMVKANSTPEQIAGLMAAATRMLIQAGERGELDLLRVFTTLPKLIETWRRCLSGETKVELPDFQGLDITSAIDASRSDEVQFQ